MDFLSHVSVKSIVGYLVAAFVLVGQLCGVDFRDLAPSISIAVANLAQAVAALVPLAFAVWGHIQLAQKHAALVNAPAATKVSAPPANSPARVAVLVGLAFLGANFLTGCASETANLTTTANSDAATVDNGASIAAGQTVTASTVPSTETVGGISGLNLELAVPATSSGTVSATFKNTLAMQLSSDEADLKTYGQTVGNALQTILPQLEAAAGNVAKITSLVQGVTSAWGLTPTTPSQNSVFTKIVNGTKTASSDINTLETFLTGVQALGAVSTSTTAATSAN